MNISSPLLPPGHPGRAASCLQHTRRLLMQAQTSNDEEIIDKAMSLSREVLDLLPVQMSSSRVDATIFLTASLKMRYERFDNDEELLTEAIDLERNLLGSFPKGHPNRAFACEHLPNSLRMYYMHTGDQRLLAEAIDIQREALSFCSETHPRYVETSGNLAILLVTLHGHNSDDQLLTEAIVLLQRTLSLISHTYMNWPMFADTLAESLRERYKQTGEESLLVEAIQLHREALNINPPGHPDRAGSCENLANSLATHYEKNRQPDKLVEAIVLMREAVSLYEHHIQHRGSACASLANLLKMQYEQNGYEHLLIEIIDLHREALALHPISNPNRAWACGHLAMSLTARYKRTGDHVLIDEAISLGREALRILPEPHPQRPIALSDLATMLEKCYEHTGAEDLLTNAISLGRQGLALCHPGHENHLLMSRRLAGTLARRFSDYRDDIGLLYESINIQREVLASTPQGHPDREELCGNLASTLHFLYERSKDSNVGQEIVALSKEALSTSLASQTVWRYAISLSWVHLQTGSLCDIPEAITYLDQALEYDEIDDILQAVVEVLTCLDDIWDHNLELPLRMALIPIYHRFISILPQLANPAIDSQSQLLALKRSSFVGSDALVNAVLAEDAVSGIESLELAQGTLWSRLFHQRDPQMNHVSESLANHLVSLLQANTAESTAQSSWMTSWTPFAPQDARHAQVARIHSLIRQIRTLPGCERFMLGETYDTLCAVASEHPVVLLAGGRSHFYALVITNAAEAQPPAVISLDLNDEDLVGLTTSSVKNLMRMHRGRDLDATYDMERPAMSEIDAVRAMKAREFPVTPQLRRMNFLWIKVVKPILDHLELKPSKGARPRLHWCASGIFSGLPLHAAGIYHGSKTGRVSCADFVVSSYTPTLTALLRAQKTAKRIPAKRSDISFTLIAEERAQETNLQVIHGVADEIRAIEAIAKLAAIDIRHRFSGSTKVVEILEALKAANIVHVACHGIQDDTNALQSGFCLADGRLTIAQLMDLKNDNAFLAFLSACETGKGDREQPDQAMHLAAAMLFSGFPSVIATMWAISDVDGPMVAKWFYEALFASATINNNTVAYALDAAIERLRDTGAVLERWAPFIHVGA